MKKREMQEVLEELKSEAREVDRTPLVPAIVRRMLKLAIVLLGAILARIPDDAPKTPT